MLSCSLPAGDAGTQFLITVQYLSNRLLFFFFAGAQIQTKYILNSFLYFKTLFYKNVKVLSIDL